MRPKVLVRAITVAVGTLLLTPAGVLAAKLTCLTGTDPSVANDLPQITAMRSLIEIACVCLSFDGTSGKTHAKYVTCAGNVIKARSTAGQLRSQCKAPVKRYLTHFAVRLTPDGDLLVDTLEIVQQTQVLKV